MSLYQNLLSLPYTWRPLKNWYLFIKTPLRRNSLRPSWRYLRWSVPSGYFIFVCSSIATPVPPPLLCSTRLTSLLNISYWARVVLYVSSEKKSSPPKKNRQGPKKKTVVEFFRQICCLTAFRFTNGEPRVSVLLGITEMLNPFK